MKGYFMQKELEIELKTLLSESQFEQLKKLFFNQQLPSIQTNTYFDTEDQSLKKCKMALRMRTLNENNVLTLKSKQDPISSFEYSISFTQTLSQTLQNNTEFREKLPTPIELLRPIATFTTQRYTTELNFGLVCLDTTSFENNFTDFEIEIELHSMEMKDKAIHWLKHHNITYVQSPPKIARALAK